MIKELLYPGDITRGQTSAAVKRVQEWLCLHRIFTGIDSEYGPGTESALARFNKMKFGKEEPNFDQKVWDELTKPMRVATKPLPFGSFQSLRSAVWAAAQQLVQWNPKEVGGDNRGPWVRLFMDGNDGSEWKWCAGFACTCVKMALAAMGKTTADLPFNVSFGCDEIASSAKKRKKLVSGEDVHGKSLIRRGDLFLVRKTASDWVHVGIVGDLSSEVFKTAEGNTNDEGSANGFEACFRERGYKGKDFVILG